MQLWKIARDAEIRELAQRHVEAHLDVPQRSDATRRDPAPPPVKEKKNDEGRGTVFKKCARFDFLGDVLAEAAETFCRAEHATYRPHPSERDRIPRWLMDEGHADEGEARGDP